MTGPGSPPAAAEPGAARPDPPGASQAALRALGTVVAPASLVAALMYYFGRLHATSFFAHLGVQFTVFDLTTFDYLVRSQDGLFLPIALAGAGALAVVWTRRVVGPRLSPRVRAALLRVAGPLAVTGGLVGVGTALVGILDPTAFATPAVAPGIGMSVGVALLARAARPAVRETGTSAVVEWAAVFVLVSVGLFWAVANYSAALGTSRAQELERVLDRRPAVTLVSEQDLGLTGVRATTCAGGGVRYDGLVLVFQSGGHYLLLPATWTRTDGPAILLPRSDTVRLEFRAVPEPGPAPTC